MSIILSEGEKSCRVKGQYRKPSWKKHSDIMIEKVPLFYKNTKNRVTKSILMISRPFTSLNRPIFTDISIPNDNYSGEIVAEVEEFQNFRLPVSD